MPLPVAAILTATIQNSQKQRIIDIFVNSVYVYDDRVVVFVNYKDGERCVDFSVVSDSGNPEDAGNSNEKKTNTHENECSPLIKSGDPGGSPTRSSRTSTNGYASTATARSR